VREEHGHGSVNQLSSDRHALRVSDTANNSEAFDQGRPIVNTGALQKQHDGLGKSPMSFFSLQESRPGRRRSQDDSFGGSCVVRGPMDGHFLV
jgi:hypothetical protein